MASKNFPSGTVIVTGAAGGMGSQCARLMAEAGWRSLLLCDLHAPALERVAASPRAAGTSTKILAGDICAPDFCAKILETLGSDEIAALIHAAGVAPQMAEADKVFEINLDAALRLLRALRPRLAAGSAAILFASIAGSFPVSPQAQAAFEQPIPEPGSQSLRHFAKDSIEAYLLAKRAIVATVKREAKSLFAERGARLVSVSPGMIDTAMTQGVHNPLTESLFANAAISRYGHPEEVAAACVFLASPAASFITGCDIRVDGGELAGLGI